MVVQRVNLTEWYAQDMNIHMIIAGERDSQQEMWIRSCRRAVAETHWAGTDDGLMTWEDVVDILGKYIFWCKCK